MGMCLQLRRADDQILQALSASDDAAIEFLCPEDDDDPAYNDGSIVDVDKAWHAIHFLLSKTVWDGELPAGFILGGTVVGEDTGYGPARLLSSSEVQSIDTYLKGLPDSFLQTEFDFLSLQKADIYPSIWDRKDPEDIEYVLTNFDELRGFVSEASKQNQGMVLALI